MALRIQAPSPLFAMREAADATQHASRGPGSGWRQAGHPQQPRISPAH